MRGIGKIFDTKYGGLIFSLFAGAAYFIIILSFILKKTANGGLIAFFFSPAIIAGAALVIMKTVKRLADEEKYGGINMFLYAHLLLMAMSVVFLLDMVR